MFKRVLRTIFIIPVYFFDGDENINISTSISVRVMFKPFGIYCLQSANVKTVRTILSQYALTRITILLYYNACRMIHFFSL